MFYFKKTGKINTNKLTDIEPKGFKELKEKKHSVYEAKNLYSQNFYIKTFERNVNIKGANIIHKLQKIDEGFNYYTDKNQNPENESRKIISYTNDYKLKDENDENKILSPEMIGELLVLNLMKITDLSPRNVGFSNKLNRQIVVDSSSFSYDDEGFDGTFMILNDKYNDDKFGNSCEKILKKYQNNYPYASRCKYEKANKFFKNLIDSKTNEKIYKTILNSFIRSLKFVLNIKNTNFNLQRLSFLFYYFDNLDENSLVYKIVNSTEYKNDTELKKLFENKKNICKFYNNIFDINYGDLHEIHNSYERKIRNNITNSKKETIDINKEFKDNPEKLSICINYKNNKYKDKLNKKKIREIISNYNSDQIIELLKNINLIHTKGNKTEFILEDFIKEYEDIITKINGNDLHRIINDKINERYQEQNKHIVQYNGMYKKLSQISGNYSRVTTYTETDSNDTYIGNSTFNGKKEGLGIMYFYDNSIYIGKYNSKKYDGVECGPGYYYDNNELYEIKAEITTLNRLGDIKKVIKNKPNYIRKITNENIKKNFLKYLQDFKESCKLKTESQKLPSKKELNKIYNKISSEINKSKNNSYKLNLVETTTNIENVKKKMKKLPENIVDSQDFADWRTSFELEESGDVYTLTQNELIDEYIKIINNNDNDLKINDKDRNKLRKYKMKIIANYQYQKLKYKIDCNALNGKFAPSYERKKIYFNKLYTAISDDFKKILNINLANISDKKEMIKSFFCCLGESSAVATIFIDSNDVTKTLNFCSNCNIPFNNNDYLNLLKEVNEYSNDLDYNSSLYKEIMRSRWIGEFYNANKNVKSFNLTLPSHRLPEKKSEDFKQILSEVANTVFNEFIKKKNNTYKILYYNYKDSKIQPIRETYPYSLEYLHIKPLNTYPYNINCGSKDDERKRLLPKLYDEKKNTFNDIQNRHINGYECNISPYDISFNSHISDSLPTAGLTFPHKFIDDSDDGINSYNFVLFSSPGLANEKYMNKAKAKFNEVEEVLKNKNERNNETQQYNRNERNNRIIINNVNQTVSNNLEQQIKSNKDNNMVKQYENLTNKRTPKFTTKNFNLEKKKKTPNDKNNITSNDSHNINSISSSHVDNILNKKNMKSNTNTNNLLSQQ